MTKKYSFKYNFKQFCVIFASAFLLAFALEGFLLNNDVIIGGVSGISSLLDIVLSKDAWYFSAGVWVVVLNLPILIFCFVKMPRRFAVKTTLYVVLLGAMLVAFRLVTISGETLSSFLEKCLFAKESGESVVVCTLIGGALHGFSLPLMLSISGSTGGSDILGMLYQRKGNRSGNQSMRFVLLFNFVIVALGSLVVYLVSKDVSRAVNMLIYSSTAIIIGEIVQETVFKGYSSAVEIEVTTDYPEKMATALREGLNHGVSIIKVQGGYSKQEKFMVVSVIDKRQLQRAKRIVKRTDENAFAYVEQVKEVIGKGFTNKEEEITSYQMK